MMNINNVIRTLRQSQKLQAISVYYRDAYPSIPANREFFEKISPLLKLLLKAFKQINFEAYVSRWGELRLFSKVLGIEVLIRIAPNTQYMSQVSKTHLDNDGYQVLEVQTPRKGLVLSYFFCGTKSKWRHIPFGSEFTSIDSVYVAFVEPIIKASRGFQGRLQSSLSNTIKGNDITQNMVYAYAKYAANNVSKAYGLGQFCSIAESKYVRESFFSRYGAMLFIDYRQGLQIIKWHKNDLNYLTKYTPEMFEPYQIACSSISEVTIKDDEHLFLLESLDKILLQKYGGGNEAENWLDEPQYYTDRKAPRVLLSSVEEASKLLLTIVR
ncbi:MAG: hypothetical protein ACI9O6_000911 [Glaciecola sp.]|jgi:hypothetical protein